MIYMKKGFTLPELIITMSILGMITSIIVINVLTAQSKATVNNTILTFVADLRSQQLKAMTGEKEGQAGNDAYGVRFNQTDYVLFKGTTYTANNPTNFSIKLSGSAQFTNDLFPSAQVVFASVSGEIINYVANSDSIILQDPTSSFQKTLKLNRVGNVISVN